MYIGKTLLNYNFISNRALHIYRSPWSQLIEHPYGKVPLGSATYSCYLLRFELTKKDYVVNEGGIFYKFPWHSPLRVILRHFWPNSSLDLTELDRGTQRQATRRDGHSMTQEKTRSGQAIF